MENALRQIPFMKLNLSFDFEKIKQEVLAIDKWYDYHPPYFALTPELAALHKNYKHCAITTVNPIARSSIVREHFAWYTNTEQTEVQNYYDIPAHQRKWYATEMASKLPTLMNLLLSITDRPILCKIVKSIGTHGLGWHSHQNDPLLINYQHKPEQCILHIPIITNCDVAHIVALDTPPKEQRYYFDTLENYKNNPRVFVENFTTGNIWFFNGYHAHAYKNYSSDERIDILIYNDLDWNSTLREVMVTQIKLYDGPFINSV